MIFVKKNYLILSTIKDLVYETVTLTLKVKHKTFNIIATYNPHYEYSSDYLVHLEEKIKSNSHLKPTFIIGDLNQDLLSKNGDRLKTLMNDYNFETKVNVPTHYQGNSASLIDVVYYNNHDSLIQSLVLPCIFSNHRFVLSTLNFESAKPEGQFIMTRVLNEKSLNEIKTELSNINTGIIDNVSMRNGMLLKA